jgi:murein DD-endopeptidase MepM/ murein hydrolase activator NlpD
MLSLWIFVLLNRLALFIALMLIVSVLVLAPGGTGTAQDAPTPTTSTTVHIVQRNQTLSEIAQLYNTSVDAIMTMNSIDDARFINVGERLLIPDAQVSRPGANFTHTVALGDTLTSVAIRYAVPTERLIERNGILHPDRLYLGQPLSVGEIGRRETTYGFYTVQPGDNPLRVAAQYGMSHAEFRSLNNLAPYEALVVGQQVVVAGEAAPMITAPFTFIQLTPEVPVQGQSVALNFGTQSPVQVEGTFMERPFTVVQDDDGNYRALLGVHSLSSVGVYRVELRLTDANGETTRHEVRLRVAEGNYGSEIINIPPERTNLLEPRLVQSELDQVSVVMSGFRQQRYFEGLMSLPASGPVTSQYGTRRSYNGSPIDNNFHGGTDFGGPVGAPITAPADGVVVLARPLQVRGNVVIVDHGWGVYTGYWHLSEISVAEGQLVERGELLGGLGNTGLVTGAHLHWEMWVHGVQVDPMQWVQQSFP